MNLTNHKSGAEHWNWRGGTLNRNGYLCVKQREHPRADGKGYVPVHILISEKALGHQLPPGVQVHHVGDKTDNSRLVICENQKYHQLLHRRIRIAAAGGNPNTDELCSCCGLPKPTTEFYRSKTEGSGFTNQCKQCSRESGKRCYRRKMARSSVE